MMFTCDVTRGPVWSKGGMPRRGRCVGRVRRSDASPCDELVPAMTQVPMVRVRCGRAYSNGGVRRAALGCVADAPARRVPRCPAATRAAARGAAGIRPRSRACRPERTWSLGAAGIAASKFSAGRENSGPEQYRCALQQGLHEVCTGAASRECSRSLSGTTTYSGIHSPPSSCPTTSSYPTFRNPLCRCRVTIFQPIRPRVERSCEDGRRAKANGGRRVMEGAG